MRQRGWIGSTPKHVLGVLDVGTSKIVCLIAAIDPGPRLPQDGARPALRVIGVGHQKSRGVKGGVITDLDEAEQATRAAIAQAERMAGVMLDSVHVSVTCGRLKSHNFTATTDVESGVVGDDDIRRVFAAGQTYVEREERMLLHLNEVGLRLDGAPAGQDPRGMAARKLSADLHAVTADEAPLRNLLLVIERCYLSARSLTPAPYASALAATSDEERRLGVICVDIGGGTTTLSMFAEGRFLYAHTAPWGGNHVTFDIARALHTPLAEAERIKALYGTLVSAQSDEHDTFSCPAAGEEEGAVRHMTRAELADIIRPRLRVMTDHIREGIASCEFASLANRCIVLTGGTSELTGIADFVANELGRPVRVGHPQAISGLPPVFSSPAFSAAAGLLLAATPEATARVSYTERTPASQSYLKQVGTWLREGF